MGTPGHWRRLDGSWAEAHPWDQTQHRVYGITAPPSGSSRDLRPQLECALLAQEVRIGAGPGAQRGPKSIESLGAAVEMDECPGPLVGGRADLPAAVSAIRREPPTLVASAGVRSRPARAADPDDQNCGRSRPPNRRGRSPRARRATRSGRNERSRVGSSDRPASPPGSRPRPRRSRTRSVRIAGPRRSAF